MVEVKSFYRSLDKVTFVIGAFLILVNIVGLYTSLDVRSSFREGAAISEQQLHDAIDTYDGRKKTYVEVLTKAVHAGIIHYWLDEGIDKYNLRIPFHENYLLHFASYVYPKYFLKYEFTDYRRAIERGIGLCSEHAIIEADVLMEKGISSRVIELSGHVVLQAEVDDRGDEWWVLDPDYGVTIPFNISEIEENPKLIESYYSDAGYDEATIALLREIFEKEGNKVVDGNGAMGYHYERWIIEQSSYVLIWIVPLVLFLPLLIRVGAKSING